MVVDFFFLVLFFFLYNLHDDMCGDLGVYYTFEIKHENFQCAMYLCSQVAFCMRVWGG